MKRTHRKKELSELQEVKLENRNLRSENNQLKKAIKRLERQQHYTKNVGPYVEIELVEEIKDVCPSCKKGTLLYVNVVGRQWNYCNQCDYDTRKIKK
jgi:hypothetical protein